MTNKPGEPLAELVAAVKRIAAETQTAFGALTAHQLNWKPVADQWSIAQCFDHLVTANQAYFPSFERVLSGPPKNPLWASLPWLPAFWGKLLIQAVAPQATRKLKAPKIFQPSSSQVEAAIIRRFIDQQSQVIRYMQATEGMDLAQIKIASPVTSLITYSLIDAYQIIVNHEQRHFLQALRVAELAGFPREPG